MAKTQLILIMLFLFLWLTPLLLLSQRKCTSAYWKHIHAHNFPLYSIGAIVVSIHCAHSTLLLLDVSCYIRMKLNRMELIWYVGWLDGCCFSETDRKSKWNSYYAVKQCMFCIFSKQIRLADMNHPTWIFFILFIPLSLYMYLSALGALSIAWWWRRNMILHM